MVGRRKKVVLDTSDKRVERGVENRSMSVIIKETTAHKRGQPYKATPELTDKVLSRLASGENLIDICNDKKMPCLRTVQNWKRADPDFREAFNLALHDNVDTLVAIMENIASGGSMSTGNVERDKLLITVIKWRAAKLHPDQYGDRMDLNVKHATTTVTIDGAYLMGEVLDSPVLISKDQNDA